MAGLEPTAGTFGLDPIDGMVGLEPTAGTFGIDPTVGAAAPDLPSL